MLMTLSPGLASFFPKKIPVGWIWQVMRALTSSQLWEKSLDLLAG